MGRRGEYTPKVEKASSKPVKPGRGLLDVFRDKWKAVRDRLKPTKPEPRPAPAPKPSKVWTTASRLLVWCQRCGMAPGEIRDPQGRMVCRKKHKLKQLSRRGI